MEHLRYFKAYRHKKDLVIFDRGFSFEDKRDVADGMISQIKATNEDFDIVWKI